MNNSKYRRISRKRPPNRPFSHSCKQRHQLEARVDNIQWLVWNFPPEPRPEKVFHRKVRGILSLLISLRMASLLITASLKKHLSSVLQLSDKEMKKKSHIPFSCRTKAFPVRALFYPLACKCFFFCFYVLSNSLVHFFREQLIESSMPSPILTTISEQQGSEKSHLRKVPATG